jgi:hypothetical protein
LPGIEALIVSIVIGGVSAVAALDRFLPRDWEPPTGPYEELKGELGARLSFEKGVLVAIFVVAGLASTLGFLAAATLVWHPVPEAAFTVRPARILFTLAGLLIGAATAGFLEAPVDRLFLKERYWDGWFVDHRRRSPKGPLPTARQYLFERRGMTFLVPILAVVGLSGFCLALDAYAYVTPSEIVVNPFFGFQERHHRYADVQSIDTRLIGRRHDQRECRILFKDGSTFSTDAPPSRLTNAELDQLAAYVYERTTVPWTHKP